MIKKLVAFIVVSAMVFHGAGRFGLLDQLYKKRFEIGLAFGVVKEIPISVCSHDYEFNTSLVINDSDHSEASPQSIIQVNEIQLFFATQLPLLVIQKSLKVKQVGTFLSSFYNSLAQDSIFHPPGNVA